MPNSSVTTFRDPYDFQNTLRGAEFRSVINAAGDYHAELTRIDLHRLWMQHSRQSLGQVIHYALPKDRVAIHFFADAQEPPVFLSGKEVASDQLICYSPGAEHHYRTTMGSHWQTMSLPAAAVNEAALALLGKDLTSPATTRLVRAPADLMSRLRNLHRAAALLAVNTPDVIAHGGVAKAIEQELTRTMVACLTVGVDVEADPHPSGRVSVMKRFEQAIETRPAEPIYLTEICAEIGVSDRTLRLHSQEHLGMSPHRYLWLRRIHLVRQALTRTDSSAKTVTDIAFDHGFYELGRFSVAYRRQFGESPSATLRRDRR
jgi:AraC-like DNA-binding protein